MIFSTKALRAGLALAALAGSVALHGGDSAIAEARREASAAIEARDPVRAETVVRQAMAAHHADDALRASLAQALLAEGDRIAARRVLDAGAMTADSQGLGWRVRGQIALADGDLPGAARAFDQALHHTPDDADLWVAIASLRFTGGEQALAVAAATRAVALDPKNPRALALRGMLIREQFGLSASLPWFEAALRIHPDDPALLEAYGATLGDMGEARAMLIVARRLVEVDPRGSHALFMQAVLAARAGQTTLARAILLHTGDAFRDMPAAMLLSGVLEHRAGNQEVAAETLERLVRMQPDNMVAHGVLARVLATRGDWRRLIAHEDANVAAGRGGPDLVALVGEAWSQVAARETGDAARADRAKGLALIARARSLARTAPAALATSAPLGVLAMHYADNPRSAANAVPYIRALLAAHQVGEALGVADRLRDENSGNAEANLLAGDVRMAAGQAPAALADYTNAAAIRFNEAVLVRMDAALRADGRRADADAMTSRYLAQNPESATAMALLAASWADDPAHARDWAALRQAMLARGLATPSTSAVNRG